jgi:hypothetical protein
VFGSIYVCVCASTANGKIFAKLKTFFFSSAIKSFFFHSLSRSFHIWLARLIENRVPRDENGSKKQNQRIHFDEDKHLISSWNAASTQFYDTLNSLWQKFVLKKEKKSNQSMCNCIPNWCMLQDNVEHVVSEVRVWNFALWKSFLVWKKLSFTCFPLAFSL